jgi:hypothetical protein
MLGPDGIRDQVPAAVRLRLGPIFPFECRGYEQLPYHSSPFGRNLDASCFGQKGSGGSGVQEDRPAVPAGTTNTHTVGKQTDHAGRQQDDSVERDKPLQQPGSPYLLQAIALERPKCLGCRQQRAQLGLFTDEAVH